MTVVAMRALFCRTLRLLGDDELVMRERSTQRAPIVRGCVAGLTTIEDDAEAGSALERYGQELVELGVFARDHNPITGHAVKIISADSVLRTRAHRTAHALAHPYWFPR